MKLKTRNGMLTWPWGSSSVWQSAAFAMRRPGVRSPSAPPIRIKYFRRGAPRRFCFRCQYGARNFQITSNDGIFQRFQLSLSCLTLIRNRGGLASLSTARPKFRLDGGAMFGVVPPLFICRMRVARSHPDVAMTQDGSERKRIRSGISHTRRGGVPQIVKMKVHDPRLLHCPLE